MIYTICNSALTACIDETGAQLISLKDKNGDVLVRAGINKTKVTIKGHKQTEKLSKLLSPSLSHYRKSEKWKNGD